MQYPPERTAWAMALLAAVYLYYVFMFTLWMNGDMRKRHDRRNWPLALNLIPGVGPLIYMILRRKLPNELDIPGKADRMLLHIGARTPAPRGNSRHHKGRLVEKVGILNHLRPLDIVTIAFLGFLVIARSMHQKGFELDELTAIVPLAVILIIGSGVLYYTRDMRRAIRVVRDWLPISIAILIYENLHAVTMMINPASHEDTLLNIDLMMLGQHPSLWLERFNCDAMSEIMVFCYSAYFYLPAIIGIPVYIKKYKRGFHTGILAVVLTFYIGFVGYICYPAVSPDHHHYEPLVDEQGNPVLAPDGTQVYETVPIIEYTEPLAHGIFANRTMTIIYSGQAVPRDAFPSLHTGVATTVLAVAFKEQRFVFKLILPVVVGLWISTMYLREHYFIDVVAGWILAIVCVSLSYWIEGIWKRKVSDSMA